VILAVSLSVSGRLFYAAQHKKRTNDLRTLSAETKARLADDDKTRGDVDVLVCC